MNEEERYAEVKEELHQLRILLQGDPLDRNDGGVIGDVKEIKQAMWGPPNRPNGLVGMVREMRVTTRTIIVGLVIAGCGVLLQQWLN